MKLPPNLIESQMNENSPLSDKKSDGGYSAFDKNSTFGSNDFGNKSSIRGGSEAQLKEKRTGLELSEEKTISEFKYTLGSRSSASKLTKLTTTVTIGLNGKAGKPGISQSESESWICDPRTPIKKFSALLFKLAGIRQALLQ